MSPPDDGWLTTSRNQETFLLVAESQTNSATTRKHTDMSNPIHEAAKEISAELAKLHSKLDIKPYKSICIRLTLDYSPEDGPKVTLTYCGDYSDNVGTISHAELGPLMDEVYRRYGFNEKSEASIKRESSSLKSLTYDLTKEEEGEI